jgi:hypothetical protein
MKTSKNFHPLFARERELVLLLKAIAKVEE